MERHGILKCSREELECVRREAIVGALSECFWRRGPCFASSGAGDMAAGECQPGTDHAVLYKGSMNKWAA